MSKKTITINGKEYIEKDVDETVEEAQTEETPVEETTEETETEESSVEEQIDAVAEKVVASLGIQKLHEKIDALAQEKAAPEVNKKNSTLIDLETLMQKDVSEMTSREKIVGFFQAMIKSNEPVLKALSEGTAADGGYLFPDEFRTEVIRDIAEDSHRMRNMVNVIPMRRDILKVPTLESRPQVTWTEENATKSTTTAHFGEATLTVKKMAAILYASDELIDDSSDIDVVNFIIGLFSEAIGEEEDRVVWRGNGTTEPTGIVTAQAAGAISAVSGAAGLSIDVMLDLIYSLPAKYHTNAAIYIHRTNIKELRKLKDSNNRHHWSDPISAGQAPTFLGYPVKETNELAESQIYFGDLKKAYWLGDRQKMTVKISQDTETAFTKDQTAIRVVSRIAGNVVLGAAAKAITSLP